MSNFFIIQKRIAISNSAFLVGMSGLWSTDPPPYQVKNTTNLGGNPIY